jgi:hypothetical protein
LRLPSSTPHKSRLRRRQDFDLPYETAQLPLFRMPGTPLPEKPHVVLAGGHIPTRMEEAIRAILDWLDKYLGPVTGP